MGEFGERITETGEVYISTTAPDTVENDAVVVAHHPRHCETALVKRKWDPNCASGNGINTSAAVGQGEVAVTGYRDVASTEMGMRAQKAAYGSRARRRACTLTSLMRVQDGDRSVARELDVYRDRSNRVCRKPAPTGHSQRGITTGSRSASRS